MNSERQPRPFWEHFSFFGRRKPTPSAKPDSASQAAEQTMRIGMPEEQRKALEQAIPFHRPSNQAGPSQETPSAVDTQEKAPEPARVQPQGSRSEVEPYRKKYKKYGRDVCLPTDSAEPYDVVSDSFDTSHHSVDKVSPL
jgi:hypothetical protein